jgi:aspartate carbamoyltransferase catalytic subunit
MNRGVEIASDVADDINRSAITEQVEMGVAVRMACLDILTRTRRNAPGWAETIVTMPDVKMPGMEMPR